MVGCNPLVKSLIHDISFVVYAWRFPCGCKLLVCLKELKIENSVIVYNKWMIVSPITKLPELEFYETKN